MMTPSILSIILCFVCVFSQVLSRKFETFPRIIDVLCKHFEIEVLDHIVFFVDKEEQTVDDKIISNYQQALNKLQHLNKFTRITYKKSNFYNNINMSLKELPTNPILFYISIPYLTILDGMKFLQRISTSDLSNHVWLFDMDTSNNCNQTIEGVQTKLQSSIINLNFDSQVSILTPKELSCDTVVMYEVYKVGFIKSIKSRNCNLNFSDI